MSAAPASRPRVAVFKLASCDGCQVVFLNLEERLLALAGRVEIAHFLEASSQVQPGPYDVSFVEGSVTSARDVERLLAIRRSSRVLVTIGACATAGGIQALRNWADVEEMARAVYPRPEWIEALSTSTPIAEHVKVDFEISGCPIDGAELVQFVTQLLAGATPRLAEHDVCLDCKRLGRVCVVVTRGLPCLGPVTRSGCGALCPSMRRDCYGCFGPCAGAEPRALAHRYRTMGIPPDELARRFRGITGALGPFRETADGLGPDAHHPR
ncbi:MAG: oxidoreductase [Deltaproteobacteria bacterium]|nr:oxidoreductase [Deltaproteobacteria bacterium]